MGAKPRKEADSKDSDSSNAKANHSDAQTPNGISPVSPTGIPSPSPIPPSRSRDDLKTDSPDSYAEYKHGHSQSATSLASCFTDTTAPSSFSAGPQSPTSPFFSSELNGGGNNFVSSQAQRSMSVGNLNSHRPRSQTFPMLGIEPGFGGSNENLTPKQVEEMMSSSVLETPVEEYSERNFSISSQDMHHLSQPGSSVHSPVPDSSPSVMAPPPNPLLTTSAAGSTAPSPISPPSQDEARRALELVMSFFQSQPSGVVDPQEYITMGRLMEKLKVQGSIGELPGGMHAMDRGQEVSRKRSIHSL
ncbi:MAG: hypothetical protein MMC23_000394 [Stictis urceolatum]|nr:hypothetical protein [Stictis urceolata]